MDVLKEQWLRWFRNGSGLDLGGYTVKQILHTANTLDFKDYLLPSGDMDKHAALKHCIQIQDFTHKPKKGRRIGKGYRNTNHPQRSDKGFFNITTRRG